MEATLPIWPLTSLQKRNSHEGHLLVLPLPNPSEDNREGTTIERENEKRRTRKWHLWKNNNKKPHQKMLQNSPLPRQQSVGTAASAKSFRLMGIYNIEQERGGMRRGG